MDDLSPEARRLCDRIKDIMSPTPVSEVSAPRWDKSDVYPPLAELRRAQMTDAEWAAMSEWEKDLWEMKHLPEKERMNSIEGIVEWLPEAQRDQRQTELLEEVLRFGVPALTLDSSTAPGSATSDEFIVLRVPTELAVVHEEVDNLVAPTPSTCSMICLGGDMSVTWAPLSPAAMPTSSASKPNKPTLTSRLVDPPFPTPAPAAAKLNSSTNTHGVVPERCCFHLELAADAPGHLVTPTHVPTMVLLDSTLASVPAVTGTSETDIRPAMPSSCLTLGPEDNTIDMIPMLSIFNFTNDLLVESDCSDTVMVPLSHVLDGISVTISAVPTDDTPQDDQAQPPGIHDVLSILLRNSLSLIIVEVYPGSAEVMQHSVMLEKLKPRLSMELHLLVLVVMRKEAVFWPIFQAASRHTIPLLPWDPGEHAKRTRNPIFICDSLLMVSWLRLPPDRNKLGGKLFLFTKGAQVDEKSLGYLHCDSETIQWEIAWTLWYECAFLVQTDRLPICNLALVEHCYSFSELSCRFELWTSWQLHFFIPGSRTASLLYALLICLKARDEMEMRLELSLQTVLLSSACCSIVLHYMGTCFSLQSHECPWFLGSGIQPGTPLFLGIDNFWFQLSTEGYIEIHHGLLLYTWSLDPWPVWDAYFSSHMLQPYTRFGSTTCALQKCRTDDYTGRLTVSQIVQVGNTCEVLMSNNFLIGGAVVYDSDIFQWEIAWAQDLECFGWSFQFRQSYSSAIVSDSSDIIYGGLNHYFPYSSICQRGLTESSGDELWCCCASTEHSLDIDGLRKCVSLDQWWVSNCDRKLHDVFILSAHFLSKALQLSWDPGDWSSSAWRQRNHECVDDARSNPGIVPSQVPWDPGGAILSRLGGKPNFYGGRIVSILMPHNGFSSLDGPLDGSWTTRSAQLEATRDNSTNTTARGS